MTNKNFFLITLLANVILITGCGQEESSKSGTEPSDQTAGQTNTDASTSTSTDIAESGKSEEMSEPAK